MDRYTESGKAMLKKYQQEQATLFSICCAVTIRTQSEAQDCIDNFD
jgi:hypothetical protein